MELLAQCSTEEATIDITIKPDNWGSEISWSLTDFQTQQEYASGGPYFDNNLLTINREVCVPLNAYVTFTIYDVYGDGICCGQGDGYYRVRANDIIVASGGQYGTEEVSSFLAPPAEFDAGLTAITSASYTDLGEIFIKGSVKNFGTQEINSLDITYNVGNGEVTETISDLAIAPLETYSFVHPTAWNPTVTGTYSLTVWTGNVNGMEDANELDNLDFKTIVINEPIPDRMDEYLACDYEFETIALASDGLKSPTDLDFHPENTRSELWIINRETENAGGSTVTIFNAGTPEQTEVPLKDENAWHFMSLPTALAFGDNGNWASSPGVQDANHSGGTFTGPTLWSADLDIYPVQDDLNGSHLDMLHGSPMSMGIAHEVDNVYWVFDSWNNDICRYDFGDPHVPGGDDHSDGKIWRYPELGIKRLNDTTPSHLDLDKETGWLYIVDNGNNRILRMNIHSGNEKNNLALINEALAEHKEYENVNWEIYLTEGFVRPCGIDYFNGKLIVTDNANGDIIIYDTTQGTPQEINRIYTNESGIMGVKVGPDGKIWYVNRTRNQVMRINTQLIASVSNMPEAICQGEEFTTIQIEGSSTTTFNVYDEAGELVQEGMEAGTDTFIPDFDSSIPGIYNFEVRPAIDASCEKTVATFSYEVWETPTVDNVLFGQTDGQTQVEIVPFGGLAPYQVSLDGGETFSESGVLTLDIDYDAEYEAVIMDANGCTSEPSTIFLSTDIENPLTNNNIQLQYVAAQNSVLVKMQDSSNIQNLQLMVTDLLGRTIVRQSLNTGSEQFISVPSIATGIYIISVESPTHKIAKKVFVN